jgi:hypothetical protein
VWKLGGVLWPGYVAKILYYRSSAVFPKLDVNPVVGKGRIGNDNALGSAYRRNAKLFADLSSQAIVNFGMARHRSFRASRGI